MWFKYVNYLHYSSLAFKYYFQTVETCQFIKLYNTVHNTRSGQTYKKTWKEKFIQVCRPLRMLKLKNLQKTRLVAQIFFTFTLAEATGICYRMQSCLYHSPGQSSALLPHTSALSLEFTFAYLHTVMQTESLMWLYKDGQSLVNGFLRPRTAVLSLFISAHLSIL